MIYGNINNLEFIENVYAKPLVKAINYLKNTDFNSLQPGKYEIEGTEIFANVMDTYTAVKSEIRPEVHCKYVDVQFLVEGKEIIGFAKETNKNKVSEDLLDEKDIKFYENVENEIELIMNPGNFAVFFPDDVHRPNCSHEGKQNIKKVVVKIHVDLF
jgi:YhcH/YjgK/YiaL family protein